MSTSPIAEKKERIKIGKKIDVPIDILPLLASELNTKLT
tara:strand:+ start:317 stop:433 length:117 start_codon:yes stop_codon:yes gene_type:complete